MTIQVGDRLPAVNLKQLTPDGIKDVPIADVTKGKKVVLFAVPGAFTPTCNNNHLPGFVKNLAAIKAKGIDTVAVTGVNDVFVMSAWKKESGGDGIEFLADGSADFAKLVGLDADFSAGGMGVRSRRYSMLIEDGVVKKLNIEEKPGTVEVSGGDTLLGQL
jgi:peroxiredoxin